MNVVGSGLLATAFKEFGGTCFAGFTIFAAGVSNSLELNKLEFEREKILLEKAIQDCRGLVYFSSCSAPFQSSGRPYFRHKMEMERLVLGNPGNFVVRLPQLVGVNQNKSQICNFIFSHLVKGEEFEVWRFAQRNILDVARIPPILENVISTEYSGGVVNICAYNSILLVDLCEIFERVIDIRGKYRIVDKGEPFIISRGPCYFESKELDKETYYKNLIIKYFQGRFVL